MYVNNTAIKCATRFLEPLVPAECTCIVTQVYAHVYHHSTR